MKISEHFDLREFVDKDTFEREGAEAIKRIDKRLILLLEKIRQLCGNQPITVNNWHTGGKFHYRGFRNQNAKIGAAKSMHKQGKAVDFDVKGFTAEEVRAIIRLNQVELMKLGLTRIETGVSWVHIDLKETGLNYIYEFRP